MKSLREYLLEFVDINYYDYEDFKDYKNLSTDDLLTLVYSWEDKILDYYQKSIKEEENLKSFKDKETLKSEGIDLLKRLIKAIEEDDIEYLNIVLRYSPDGDCAGCCNNYISFNSIGFEDIGDFLVALYGNRFNQYKWN